MHICSTGAQFSKNLNFITFDKLSINLGKTYAKLRIFPKIFGKLGPRFITALRMKGEGSGVARGLTIDGG